MERRQREVGLVALQAAVLTRRIFLPATRRGDLGPEHWQVLLAIALAEGAADGEPPAGSAEGLAALLCLDRDHVHGLLFSLHTGGYLEAVEDGEDDEDDDTVEMPRFALSATGRAALESYLERAARFLPGWPPARVS